MQYKCHLRFLENSLRKILVKKSIKGIEKMTLMKLRLQKQNCWKICIRNAKNEILVSFTRKNLFKFSAKHGQITIYQHELPLHINKTSANSFGGMNACESIKNHQNLMKKFEINEDWKVIISPTVNNLTFDFEYQMAAEVE